MRLTSFIIGLTLLAGAGAVSAHHSFAAEYDREKPLTLTGAVTRIEWQNPHAYFYMDVKDPATGRTVNWAFEMGAPARPGSFLRTDRCQQQREQAGGCCRNRQVPQHRADHWPPSPALEPAPRR